MITKIINNSNNKNYLSSLNLREDDNKTWLPQINDEELKICKEENLDIVLANDWFSQGAYDYGVFSFNKYGELCRLQELSNTKILNPNENFIFEEGSMDYKGLIAIGVEPGTEYFIALIGGHNKCDIEIYFPENSNNYFIDNAIDSIACVGDVVFVHKDQKLSLKHFEYVKMKFEFNPFLV